MSNSLPKLGALDESHCGGVHAVAQAGGLGAIVKDVAQVGLAFGAGNLVTDHAQASVGGGADIFFGDGRPETGPAGAGIKLGVGSEQGVVAAYAAVEAWVVNVVLPENARSVPCWRVT